jgi:L-serine deaminase
MAKNELVAKLEKNQQQIAKLNREIEKAVASQIEKKAKLEADNESMKAAILDAMEENDVDKFDGDLITITRVKATTRTAFDSKKFQAERPKTYAKYLKTGTTKAYIKLKVKA